MAYCQTMNGQLRGLDMSEFTDHTLTQTRDEIKALDDAFAKATPLPENVTVYRGVSDVTMLGDFTQGEVLTDPGFLSTSLDKRVAGQFSDQEAGKGVVLELRIPAGTKAIPLSGAAGGDAQSELLLNRGSRFRVISKTWFGHGWRVVAELI
jgi:ADP-ribosyltransferase exoenzyme